MYIDGFFNMNARWNKLVRRLGVVLCALVALAGCAPGHQTALGSDHETEWQPWQVIETQTGRVVASAEWLRDLEDYEIIYLGEEHFNKHHIEAALLILDRMVSAGIKPTIGIEMFGWDGQAALDDYLSNDRFGRSEFLEQVKWVQNWGHEFAAYEPLVAFAREQHLTIRAMNPPKPLVRRVVKFGLAQVRQEPEWTQWGMDREEIVDDPSYRARRCCPGGGSEGWRPGFWPFLRRAPSTPRTSVAYARRLRFRDSAPVDRQYARDRQDRRRSLPDACPIASIPAPAGPAPGRT